MPELSSGVRRSLLTGLAVVLPGVVTVYILWVLFRVTGAVLAVPVEFLVRNLVGRDLADTASTLISAVLTAGLLLAVGALAQRVGRSAFHRVEERVFRRLPVARGIHRAVRQLFDLFFAEGSEHRAVGLVEYPRPGMYALCFITSRDLWHHFFLLVPPEDVRLLDISVEEAARIIISGGSVRTPGRPLRATALVAYPGPAAPVR